MADRQVKVTLTAVVSGYVAAMKSAEGSTKQMSNTTKNAAADQAAALKKFNTVIGGLALGIGVVAAAGVVAAVKSFADFDAKMAQVQSLSHATAGEMDQLRTATMGFATDFGISASQAADAEIELVKAGISVKDQIGGALSGALTLAADGQMDVASATQIAAEAMTQFQLKGKDVPHIADLLAAGADKALGSVGDLGNALESGGLVAAQFGLSIDDTVGTLSAFAQAGIIGESAGTDLRQMLLKLAAPSAESTKTMKDLGISLYDASGKFVGITSLAGQLKDKLSGLSAAQRNNALATIFGSRAIQGANVLYQNGAKGVQSWINKVNDSGFAAKQAAGKMDSLNGDVQKLKAAFQNDLIQAGSGANDVLRDTTQVVTGLVRAFGDLPPNLQQGALGLTALVSAAGLVGGAFILGLPKVVAFQGTLRTLANSDMPAVASAAQRLAGITGGLGNALSSAAKFMTGPWGVAVGVAVAVVGTFVAKQEQLKQTSEDLADTLNTETGKITANTQAYVANNLQKDGTLKAAAKIGIAEKDVVNAYLQQPAALKKIRDALNELKDPNDAYSKALAKNGVSATDTVTATKLLNQALADGAPATAGAKERQKELAAATKKSGDASETATQQTKDNSAALDALQGTADDASGAITDLSDTLNNLGKGALDVSSAQIGLQQSLADATQAAKDNGATLDINTQKGRDNQSALDGVAKSVDTLLSSQNNAGASTTALTATMVSGRAQFIEVAKSMGKTTAQANALADQYGLIPSNVSTAVKITGVGPTLAEIQRVKDSIGSIERNIAVSVKLNGAGNLATTGGLKIANANGNILDFYANGGESHTAQISAGVTRVWAEPETGGEAYIPLGASKRQRSLAIWQTVGRRLGVQGFADGGVTYVGPSGGGSSNSSVSVSPVVSLAGARMTLMVGGRQIEAVIQDQIVANNQAQTLKGRRGW